MMLKVALNTNQSNTIRPPAGVKNFGVATKNLIRFVSNFANRKVPRKFYYEVYMKIQFKFYFEQNWITGSGLSASECVNFCPFKGCLCINLLKLPPSK